MSYKIPLSVIRECCGAPVDKECADNMVDELKINTSALGLMLGDERDLLVRAAGLGCVERWDGRKWILMERGRLRGWMAYRLHHDCVVVDDTTEKWIECEVIHRSQYFTKDQKARWWLLVDVCDHEDFVCVRVTDEAGGTWYLDHWSPYSRWTCASIEELVSRSAGDTPRGRLTPTHVIFEGGE